MDLQGSIRTFDGTPLQPGILKNQYLSLQKIEEMVVEGRGLGYSSVRVSNDHIQVPRCHSTTKDNNDLVNTSSKRTSISDVR